MGATSALRSLPSARTPVRSRVDVQASGLASDGIPAIALRAYEGAARAELATDPACALSWPLLAGIGRVESDHGRFDGAVLHTNGVSTPRIIGIALNGVGTARILDTDRGRLDGDTVYDRAVGPMQFIPSTWAYYGADGNGDHIADPFNIYDAAATAAHYLCAAGGTLTTLAGQERALRAYNDSDAYIALVLSLEGVYARSVPGLVVPFLRPDSPLSTERPNVPAANPGPPLSVPAAPVVKPGDPARPGPPAGPTPTTPEPSGSTCPPATPTSSPSPSASPTDSATASASDSASPSDPASSTTTPTDSASEVVPPSSSPASTSASTTSATPVPC